MAITYTSDFKGQNNGVAAAITSNTISCATGDFICVIAGTADNAVVTAWTITNNNTAITWTQRKDTNTTSNCRLFLFTGTAGASAPTTITATATAGADTSGNKIIAVMMHAGFNSTTPLPINNVLSAAGGQEYTVAVPLTAYGSALWMVAGDWNALNTFAAGTNCTLVNTFHEAGQGTYALLRPTTQPRQSAATFSMSETETGTAKIAYIVFEVQAAQIRAPLSDIDNSSFPKKALRR